ncbi:MAG: ImmA/IrrE family metallo-endopeptidase [Candidatus Abawacabacteria bacterium]|nr:ImmA/IrrE family metallo-endopeptidase [Candidatus Abawacabacteria bacterium]
MQALAKPLQEEAERIILELYAQGEFDVLALCQQLNIKVFNVHCPKPHQGSKLTKHHKSWTICVNGHEPREHQRFLVAHELGHFFSHQYGLEKEENINTYECCIDEEGKHNHSHTQASQFAAQIMMPESTVRALYQAGNNLGEMARYFGVSEAAMSFRLIDLGYGIVEQTS